MEMKESSQWLHQKKSSSSARRLHNAQYAACRDTGLSFTFQQNFNSAQLKTNVQQASMDPQTGASQVSLTS